MRLIFAGTPDFAVAALLALIEAGHNIALVLTRPDKPAGRKMLMRSSKIKDVALHYRLNIAQPNNLKHIEAQSLIGSVGADLMIVAAYGLLLPQSILVLPKYGCLNIHASLLPRWRGAAPIQRAIEAGDKETGVTITQMDAGLDTGPILSWQPMPILPNDNAAMLSDKLAKLGAELLTKTLDALHQITPTNQSETGVCYAEKIQKAEGHICWTDDALTIVRKIHAFNPSPGAFTYLHHRLVKLWGAELINDFKGKPGEIIDRTKTGIIVAAGSKAVRLTALQFANSKRLPAEALINNNFLQCGEQFGA
ncbi:MAG: methionyl-tRNA formyltransferase [Neisseriales bacterium]|nr:MAG: methionyl-tRNA formyltransferase [Neisseriales bacterium]